MPGWAHGKYCFFKYIPANPFDKTSWTCKLPPPSSNPAGPLPMIHGVGLCDLDFWNSEGLKAWWLPISAISLIGICWGDDPDSNFQAFFASTKLALWWLPEATTKRCKRWKRARASQEFGARTVRVNYAFGFILSYFRLRTHILCLHVCLGSGIPESCLSLTNGRCS